MEKKRGRVTIPTDLNVIPQTLEILEKWGADAVRDCDGTEFPAELKEVDAKVYATIIQQERIMSGQRHIRKKSSRCTL